MAYQITGQQYRDEWIHSFQRGETYLKDCTTKEIVTEGSASAVFAIAGVSSGMTERGANGLIPTRSANDRQVTLALKEKHTLENQTKFNVFTSQSGKLRETMQTRSRMDAYREIDDEIILALQDATNDLGAITPNAGTATDVISELWEANAGDDVCFVWTPKSFGKILMQSRITSADYVDSKPLMGNVMRPLKWNNAYHFMHTGLPGVGTASATNFAFAKAAVGHAIATGETDVAAGFNEEQAYSWDRATIYHKAAILQQAGVREFQTDDTAAVPNP